MAFAPKKNKDSMESLVFKVTLPEKISLNKIYAGVHWSKRKELADLFHSEFLDKKNLKVKQYPVWILYEFHFKKNALDSLNCAFMAKCLEDGMVTQGILKGDAPDLVHASMLTTQKSDQYQSDTVIIKINSK